MSEEYVGTFGPGYVFHGKESDLLSELLTKLNAQAAELARVKEEHQALLDQQQEELEGLLQQVAQLQAIKTPDASFTYCAYCGEKSPVDEHNEDLSAHIKVCPKHPMREVEAGRDRLAQVLENIIAAWRAQKTPKESMHFRSVMRRTEEAQAQAGE